MLEKVVGIAILSLLTGAALNSMASGLVPDTNGGHQFNFFFSGIWVTVSSQARFLYKILVT